MPLHKHMALLSNKLSSTTLSSSAFCIYECGLQQLKIVTQIQFINIKHDLFNKGTRQAIIVTNAPRLHLRLNK